MTGSHQWTLFKCSETIISISQALSIHALYINKSESHFYSHKTILKMRQLIGAVHTWKLVLPTKVWRYCAVLFLVRCRPMLGILKYNVKSDIGAGEF